MNSHYKKQRAKKLADNVEEIDDNPMYEDWFDLYTHVAVVNDYGYHYHYDNDYWSTFIIITILSLTPFGRLSFLPARDLEVLKSIRLTTSY